MKCAKEACPQGFRTCCGSCEARAVCGDVCKGYADRSCKYRILPRYAVRKKTSFKWIVDTVVIALLILLMVWTGNLNMMAEDALDALSETRQEIDVLRTTVPDVDKQVDTDIKPAVQKQGSPTGAYLGEYTITYYCPCKKCCGKTDGITKSGAVAAEGRTVGADLSVLPLGTKIYIDGIGERVVEDTGSGIEGKHLDVFVADHQRALELGRDKRKVYRVGA